MQLHGGDVGAEVVGGVSAAVSVQNTSTVLEEQATTPPETTGTGVLATETAGTGVVAKPSISIVENGDSEETSPTISVCRVVGVGEMSSGAAALVLVLRV